MTSLRYILALLMLLVGFQATAGNTQGLDRPGPTFGHKPGWSASPVDVGRHVDVRQPRSRVLGRYGSAMTTAQYGGSTSQARGQDVIPPSVALRVALSYSPGSQGLGVDLLQGRRLVYAVKLKTGNRVHRVLVDAQTGQVVGE